MSSNLFVDMPALFVLVSVAHYSQNALHFPSNNFNKSQSCATSAVSVWTGGEGCGFGAEPETVHVEAVVYLVVIHIINYIQTLTVRTDVNQACLG